MVSRLCALIDRLKAVGVNPADPDDLRLQKRLLVRSSLMFMLAGFLWGAAYFLLGESLAGWIPFGYSIISFISLVYYCLAGKERYFRISQLFLILGLPFLLMMALGGYANSSAVILWSLICPVGAMLFSEPRWAPFWLVAYLGLLIAGVVFDPFGRSVNTLEPSTMLAFYALNIGGVSIIVFSVMFYFVREKNRAFNLLSEEQGRSERLLLNVLPHSVAGRLKGGEQIIADHYDQASILFADMVGFTPLSSVMAPAETVALLNQIFTDIDRLVDRYGVEKIRLIGDNYMAAAGIPVPREDHAAVLTSLAMDICAYISSLPPMHGRRLVFRIGINSGPVVAGVVGQKKFAYDVWGDTVNLASRMESQGEPGRIQITAATYELIKEQFECEPRGDILVKGKGMMPTWFVEGIRQAGFIPVIPQTVEVP
jgi:guanylate cyclase